jgi:hypothetical protein
MKRRTWRIAAVVAVLGAAAALLALSAGRGREAAQPIREADAHLVGVERDAPAGEKASKEVAHATSALATARSGRRSAPASSSASRPRSQICRCRRSRSSPR